MKNRFKIGCAAFALTVSIVAAAATKPLDFDYRISGDARARPILVFNDGVDVYIQPNPETAAEIKITGAQAEREGPYWVIRGLASGFSVLVKKGISAEVSYKGNTAEAAMAYAKAKGSEPVMDTMGKKVASGKQTCETATVRKEAALAVSFPAKSNVMSPTAETQLIRTLTNAENIKTVDITSEGINSNHKSALARIDAIKKVMLAQGVKSEAIKSTTRAETGIGTEINLLWETNIPCVGQSGVSVSYRNLDHVSIATQGEAKEIIDQLAKESGRSFSVEGREIPIQITVAEIDRPLVKVLESIGEKLGDKADVIYRQRAIVLRYRTLK